ncbi:hypothetical protein T440DRAFT_515304 [Plenodomus tracheiphilus IPT5]|uniref:Mid2 domain-containing protein n=1 Tax=Plenodomus tracheiphilus IPT5 TaxID=1408161 RepID=A0A6A7BI76_9PLEO|nr:hypothetical protein T440DRAFT_515304 [Plenodomus tracheiphilus IPT5]
MFSLVSSFLFLLLTFAPYTESTSQIALFSDDSCKNSLRGMTGPNGYPNGTCTDLRRSGPYGSFQIVGLDESCTVTVYEKDATDDPCSGYAELAQPIDCYNSTYVYYSIDFCLPGGAQASIVPTSTPSASSGLSAGAIAGAVIGGVAGLGIIVAIIVIVVIRRKKAKRLAKLPQESGGTDAQLRYRQAPHEIGRGSVMYKNNAVEIEQPPIELGGPDSTQPPVELESRERTHQDDKATHRGLQNVI